MKATIHTLSALLSGAFLNLGLDRLAERFDPINPCGDAILDIELGAAAPCVGPCSVPAQNEWVCGF